MSFVKGQTTWQNLVPKIMQLACGEVADDEGTTVASGDRWRRMGANADHAIKMPASASVNSGPQANRIGYFAATSNAIRAQGGVTPAYLGVETTTFVRVTSCFTSDPTYTDHSVTGNPTVTPPRWFVNVFCTQANSVPGDYSDSKWTVRFLDSDQPNHVAGTTSPLTFAGEGFYKQINLSPAADGTLTLPSGLGLVLQVGDPSDTVQVGVSYLRLFTNSTNGGYAGGIDYWPQAWRADAGSVVFDTAPTSGVQDTDYEVITPGSANAQYPGALTGYNGYSFTNQFTQFPIWLSATRMGFGLGLGVKTDTALDGSRYLVHWNMTPFMCRMFAGSGGTNGQIYMEPGLVDTDAPTAHTVTAAYGFSTGGLSFLKPFTTPGAVDPNAPVQYWLKVSDKCLVICLNADPGFTGTTTNNWIVRLDQFSGDTIETFPVFWGHNIFDGGDYVYQHTLQSRAQLQVYQNGLKEGVRDWQIGWMRCDFGTGEGALAGGLNASFNGTTYVSTAPNDTNVTASNPNSGVSNPDSGPKVFPLNQYETNRFSSTNYAAQSTYPDREAHPNPYDGTWSLYTNAYIDGFVSWLSDSGVSGFRGYMDCGVYYLPGYLWAVGDELVDDNPGGQTYFLFSANYWGTGYRGAGGLAIAES